MEISAGAEKMCDMRAGTAENPCTLTTWFHFIYFLAVNSNEEKQILLFEVS